MPHILSAFASECVVLCVCKHAAPVTRCYAFGTALLRGVSIGSAIWQSDVIGPDPSHKAAVFALYDLAFKTHFPTRSLAPVF